ncbi:hypothetical protein GALMADRAFT_218831 [Galerina marginata CBS 339.88]|uniref:F-box domain-containing protein n=1 Tax=Galerina marginata (strain CBS 339.88) TaxID=685588 RepID=A0A067TTT4_GALM3|nr:hypothetical protein GALMADRAFT_218831 [Galerina marginata CBS 339.88]
MSPRTKKRKTASLQGLLLTPDREVGLDQDCVGAFEDVSNSEKGLLQLPVELWTEIFDNFLDITPFTRAPHRPPVLPKIYLERTDVLRALSQVSVAYRRAFLPFVWTTFNVCCEAHHSSGVKSSHLFNNPALEASSAFKHVGGTLIRKCDGLFANPDLRPYIRTVNVVFTRYRSAMVIPRFPVLLQSLPNLRTLHILHADYEMLDVLEDSLKDVLLPTVRTLIVQGSCHNILKCCPNVTTVWCISNDHNDNRKLVPFIQLYCKLVEELRGFSWDETSIKDIIEAAPNLRALDMCVEESQIVLNHLASFKDLNTITIKTSTWTEKYPALMEALQKCVRDTKTQFEDLPTAKERRYIHVIYDDKDRRSSWNLSPDARLDECIAYRHTVKYGNISRILTWSGAMVSEP